MTTIIRGRKRKPLAMVVYGIPGVGKTDFAGGAPNPIFIGPEENDEKTYARFPIVKTFAQQIGYMDELIKGVHKKEGFETVVIDSIDAIEKLICKEIVASEPGKNMSTARKGYGKAWDEVGQKLWQLREKLEVLRDTTNYNIIVLAHSIKNKFSDPLLETEYDTYEMSLHKGKKTDFNSYFTEWASTVFFINSISYKSDDGQFARSLGRRQLFTECRPSHVAKNRFNLPYQIELDPIYPENNNFKKILAMIDSFYNGGGVANTAANDLAMLLHEVKTLANTVNDDTMRPAVLSAITNSQNNYNELAVIKNRLLELTQNQ